MTIDEALRRDLLSSAPGAPKKAENAASLDLDQLIVSSSKQVLLKKIEFQAAEKDVSFCLQNLRGKYEPLNSTKGKPNSQPISGPKGNTMPSENGQVILKSDGIPRPKLILYNPEKLSLEWQKCHRIGAGLINMGNTCFLNSTLQCLSYTPPLVNYLLSQQHKEQCQMVGFCMLCELHNHLVRVGQHHGQAVRPMVIIHKLKHIAKHMHLGRQEDAHEFLRYVIEAMQRSTLYGYDKLEKFSKETSVVHQIFGGYYRSRVICSLCQHQSDTFDPFLDIGLDIKHVPSVNKALDRLIRPEVLDGDNKYKCARCKRQVAAQKKFTIHRSSNVLTLCLKKFDFQRFGSGKLHKDISYPEVLNVRPYMSDVKGPPVFYNLYAVLTHQGVSCNSGHYFCFVRAPNKMWYCMNDAQVSQASLHRVLSQDAYLLFYIRKTPTSPGIQNGPKEGPKARIAGPFMPKTIKSAEGPGGSKDIIGPKKPEAQRPLLVAKKPLPRPLKPILKPTLKPGSTSTGIQAKKIDAPSQTTPVRAGAFQAPSSRGKPLSNKREKISFSIKSQGVASTLRSLQQEQQRQKTEPLQDRGVVIDKGKRIGQKMQNLVRPKSFTSPRQGLVPYAEGDSSESDSDENYDDVAKRLSQQVPQTSGSDQPSTSVASSSTQSGSGEVKPEVAVSGESTSNVSQSEVSKSKGSDQGKAPLAESTDLTTIQSHDSPLKLTITTNGNAQRIKSTSTWNVNHSETLMSPSINSESSTGSVSSNSTQDWNVSDRPKDKSRKSRKENGSAGKHMPPTFPMLDKSGGTESGEFFNLESPESKSSVVRQITFSSDLSLSRKDLPNVAETEEVLGKDPDKSIVHRSGDSDVATTTGHQRGSLSQDSTTESTNVSKDDKCTGRLEGNKSEPRDKSQLPESKSGVPSEESDRTTSYHKGVKGITTEQKAGDKLEEQKPLSNGDLTTHNNADVMVNGDLTSSTTHSMEEPKPPGIKERLFKKINSQRNKMRKRRDSGDDKESLLAKEECPEDESVVENHEWYIVPDQKNNEECERSKKKKKKKKRKHRDEDEAKETDEIGVEDSGKYLKTDGLDRKIFPEELPQVKTESDSHNELSALGSHKDSGVKHKRFVEEEEDVYPQKRLIKDDGHSSKDLHRSRKKPRSSSDSSEEVDPSSQLKEKRRRESNSSESSSVDPLRERHHHHHKKAKKRKHHQETEKEEDRKGLLDDFEEGEVRSPERSEGQRNQYCVNGDEAGGSYHSGEGDSMHHKPEREVHRQNWDHHIRGNHRKPHRGNGRGSWDGRWTNSNDTVQHLSRGSMGGYGSMVQSWDGGKSLVDEEAENDSRHAKRRDMYDEEFDEGKVKKVKRRDDDQNRYDQWGHHRNPFQQFQNNRNRGRSAFHRNKFGHRGRGNRGYNRFGHKSPRGNHRGSNWR